MKTYLVYKADTMLGDLDISGSTFSRDEGENYIADPDTKELINFDRFDVVFSDAVIPRADALFVKWNGEEFVYKSGDALNQVMVFMNKARSMWDARLGKYGELSRDFSPNWDDMSIAHRKIIKDIPARHFSDQDWQSVCLGADAFGLSPEISVEQWWTLKKIIGF